MIAVNADKLELEGVWIATHILFGFGANLESLAIRLPTSKNATRGEMTHVIER